MPFGVARGSATFESLMNQLQDDIKHYSCMAFMDDILVYLATLEDQIVHVCEVLQWVRAAGVTINLDKVQIFQKSLIFLSCEITRAMLAGSRESECRDELPTAKHCETVASFPWTCGLLLL